MAPNYICIPVFTAALFTIAKTWKSPKCSLTEEWKKMWYRNAMELLSHEKDLNNAILINMHVPRIVILSEVSQPEKKYLMTCLICAI